MKVKLHPADTAFSKCIRERTDYTCENCGTQYSRTVAEGGNDPRGLHCSHFHGRKNKSVRFDPDNCFAHCYGCHSHFEQNPHEFTDWALKRLGRGAYDILLEKKHNINLGKEIHKLMKSGEVARHYRTQLKVMQEYRNAGKVGRIEFIGF